MAEIVLKVEADATGHLTGDIVSIYTDEMIAAYWAQIPEDDPEWIGADRTRMPLSETMLSHFLVLRVTDSPVPLRQLKQVHRDQATNAIINHRRYWIDWENTLGLNLGTIANIKDRNLVVDLRGTAVNLTGKVNDRAV